MILPLISLVLASRSVEPPVTLPMVQLAFGAVAVPGSVNGVKSIIGIGIEYDHSVVFSDGPWAESGMPSHDAVAGAGVGLGPFQWSGVKIVSSAPNNVYQGMVRLGSFSGFIGVDRLKSTQLGFDFQAGTVTFWRGARAQTLRSWAVSAQEPSSGRELAFSSRPSGDSLHPQVLVHYSIGGTSRTVSLASLMGPMGASAALTGASAIGPAATGLGTNWLDGSRPVRPSLGGAGAEYWNWITASGLPWDEYGADAMWNIKYLGIPRIVVDPPRHMVYFAAPTADEEFVWWLARTSNLPLASKGNQVRWCPKKAWAIFNPDRTDAGDFEVAEIAGYPIEQLKKAFASKDAASAQLLVEFAERIWAKSFDTAVRKGTRTLVIHTNR